MFVISFKMFPSSPSASLSRASALHDVVLILVMLIILVVIHRLCVEIDISALLFSLRLLHRRPKARAMVVSLRIPESPWTVHQASWP